MTLPSRDQHSNLFWLRSKPSSVVRARFPTPKWFRVSEMRWKVSKERRWSPAYLQMYNTEIVIPMFPKGEKWEPACGLDNRGSVFISATMLHLFKHSCIHLFYLLLIHLFSKYLLTPYYIEDTGQDPGDEAGGSGAGSLALGERLVHQNNLAIMGSQHTGG